MIVTIVHVYVKKEFIEDFIEITRYNHENSVKEPGNLRFDILKNAGDPGKFVLYEAYESEEAAKAHKQTGHYQKWRETVAEWMAQPREGIKYNILFPNERSQW